MKAFILQLWLSRNSGPWNSSKPEELHSSLAFQIQTVATKEEAKLFPLNGQRAERVRAAVVEKES